MRKTRSAVFTHRLHLGASQPWLLAFVVVVAATSGVAVALLPPTLSLLVLGGVASLPLVLLVRALLRPHQPDGATGTAYLGHFGPVAPAGTDMSPDQHGRPGAQLRFARSVYYLGLLLIGLLTFRPILSLTLSDWVFLAALFVAWFELLAARHRISSAFPPLLAVGVILFAVGGFLSSTVAEQPVRSLIEVLKFVYLGLAWFWLGTVLLQTLAHVRTAMLLWTISAGVSGGAAIVQLLWGDVIPGSTINQGRMPGLTLHVNDLGGLTAVALVPALTLAMRPTGSLVSGLLAYIPTCLIGAGLILSGSVGGLLAAAAGLCVWLISGRFHARFVLFLLAAGVGALILLNAQEEAGAPTPWKRVTSVTANNHPDATLWSRMDTYRAAWQQISADPFVGAGLDPISQKADGRYQVHNVLLGAWFEAGLFGALGIALILATMLGLARNAVSHARSREEWLLALALFAGCVAFIVFAMGAPAYHKRYEWISLALVLALRAQQKRSRARPIQPIPMERAPIQSFEALVTP